MRCRECDGQLRVFGIKAGNDSIIMAGCTQCGKVYELGPDGLGQGGMEWRHRMGRGYDDGRVLI